MSKESPILDQFGKRQMSPNGKPRPELANFFAVARKPVQARMSYDAARSGTDLDNHWAYADAYDADSANSKTVRHTLVKRSRYEAGSSGYYKGITRTHCNMLVGVGPSLRMTTQNRAFNQLVEREWFAWTQQVQLRRKLWAMCHARTQDGESFAILQTNPLIRGRVQLDITTIEAEQCQTPYLPHNVPGYTDGIRKDSLGNILWYDILPEHPGGSTASYQNAIRVAPSQVLHWFKLERPGSSRGIPDMTSTMNLSAGGRRQREATLSAYEQAANISVMLETQLRASDSTEPDPISPLSTFEMSKNMIVANPMGWHASQMKAEHPNAQYTDFHRQLVSEQARPLSMPYNAAACDSSTYSFASGKLDTLCYRAALDVERQDCNDLVLDPLFFEWFKEWTTSSGFQDAAPSHQWDWPAHPVIDAVAEASARRTALEDGVLSLRQALSDEGQDLEDHLNVMAEDYFGEASDENVRKARAITAMRTIPAHLMQYVAPMFGIESTPQSPAQPAAPGVAAMSRDIDALTARVHQFEAQLR